MRFVYRWTEGRLKPAGSILDAHLRAWEYDLASDTVWRAEVDDGDTVRLWRTRRPDLAPAELWVGDGNMPGLPEPGSLLQP